MDTLYDGYDDGTRIFTPDGLMELVLNKYNTLVEKGDWMAETAEQKQIVALQAHVATLHKALDAKKSKSPKSDKKKKKKDNDHKTKRKRTNNDKGDKKGKYPAWKLVAPEGNAPTTKQVKGKTFYWCKHHQLWTAHKESDCAKGKTGGDAHNDDALRPDLAALNAHTADDDDSSI